MTISDFGSNAPHNLKVVGSNPTPAPNKSLISFRISGTFLLADDLSSLMSELCQMFIACFFRYFAARARKLSWKRR